MARLIQAARLPTAGLAHGATEIRRGNGVVGTGPAMSNNVAEYAGLHAGLQAFFEHVDQFPGEWNVFDLHNTLLQVRGDSNLAINQMSNVWKAKAGLYLPYYEKAAKLCRSLRALGVKITFDWVPRELNRECDGLSKNVSSQLY